MHHSGGLSSLKAQENKFSSHLHTSVHEIDRKSSPSTWRERQASGYSTLENS